VKIIERIKLAMKMRRIEGSVKNSRTMMRDESGDDSEDGKP
jgi:hypothetical protein